jgi:hypothetical protein
MGQKGFWDEQEHQEKFNQKSPCRSSSMNIQSFPLLWGTVATFGKPICKRRRINQ